MQEVRLKVASCSHGLDSCCGQRLPAPAGGMPHHEDWALLGGLVGRASNGQLAHVNAKQLSRQTCVDNADMLIPVIRHLGSLAAFGLVSKKMGRVLPVPFATQQGAMFSWPTCTCTTPAQVCGRAFPSSRTWCRDSCSSAGPGAFPCPKVSCKIK